MRSAGLAVSAVLISSVLLAGCAGGPGSTQPAQATSPSVIASYGRPTSSAPPSTQPPSGPASLARMLTPGIAFAGVLEGDPKSGCIWLAAGTSASPYHYEFAVGDGLTADWSPSLVIKRAGAPIARQGDAIAVLVDPGGRSVPAVKGCPVRTPGPRISVVRPDMLRVVKS